MPIHLTKRFNLLTYYDVFASLALYPEAASIPREAFLPRRKGVNFDEFRCPFGCDKLFVTKAALQCHRVRLHKFRGAPKDMPDETFDNISLTDDIDHIIRRANGSSKKFVVQTMSNTFEWRTLPLDL